MRRRRRRPRSTSPSSTPPRPTAARSSPRSFRSTEFYSAEAYHQDYLTLNPTQPYIVHHDLPKIVNLKSMFPQQYRAEPALVMARAGKAQQ